MSFAIFSLGPTDTIVGSLLFSVAWDCSLSFQSFALRQLVTRPQHHEATVTIMVTGLTSTKSDTIFSSILNKGFFLSNLTRI